MRVAVAGATGLAGRHVCHELRRRGADVLALTRAAGTDLIAGHGLDRALEDVNVVIDASNVASPHERMTRRDAVGAAMRNLVSACARARVQRLVLLSIINVDDSGFDDFAYYRAKQDQESILRASSIEHVIVRSAQWFEFATNPSAVTLGERQVSAQDWLIQPIAVATVGEVLVEAALDQTPHDLTVAGPDLIRLPVLTARYLEHAGDHRPVITVPVPFPAFADGTLLPDADARKLAPSLSEWLDSLPAADAWKG